MNVNVTILPTDRYKVLKQLGKNAGRQTLLAHDYQTNQEVVIKLLTFDQDFEWDDLKLFEREAETLKALSHPNIPQYLDFFEIASASTKQLALVQSYVEGRSLHPALRKPPHSDITLHHTDNLLEVVIPPTGIGWGSIALFSLVAPVWIFWLDAALDWAIGGLTAATMTITVLLTIVLGIRLLHALAKRRLRIYQNQVLLSPELLGICIWRRAFQRQAIGWIIAQQQPSLLDPKVVLRFTRGNASQDGALLFYLHILSKTEAKWLAHELGQWLDVPFKLH